MQIRVGNARGGKRSQIGLQNMINLREYLICNQLTHWLGVSGIDDYITEERPDKEHKVNMQLNQLDFMMIHDLLLPVNAGDTQTLCREIRALSMQPAANHVAVINSARNPDTPTS